MAGIDAATTGHRPTPPSLPGPIKGMHTLAGAHRPRLHSPFLPSSLRALPSLTHFSRHHLPPSPGHLAAFCSREGSQAGSSPPPLPFWLPPVSISEPEHRPSRSLVSSVPPSMASPPWTKAGRGPRPVDRVHDFFLTKIIHKEAPGFL
jgi:hypothetical protein